MIKLAKLPRSGTVGCGLAGAMLLIAVAPVFVLSGCHSSPPLTAQQVEGQRLYAGRCAHCHEENDLGLKPAPPNIHGAMGKEKLPSGAPATDAEVRRQVIYGKGKMPGFYGRFNEEQMAALLSYLHTDMPLPQ